MPNDPGLAGDTCIFMEAIPGDGGNQNPNDVWWLSPDITLIGPVSGLDRADAGQSNAIKIKFRRKPAASGCVFPGDESINVEAWVANPSLVMAPRRRGSAARVGLIGSPVPPEGGNHIQQIDWMPPATSHPTPLFDNPQAPGSKCLVALCYPSSLTPSTKSVLRALAINTWPSITCASWLRAATKPNWKSILSIPPIWLCSRR